MILSFKTAYNFPEKIISGVKIHTFRDDPKDRWEAGIIIHFATGLDPYKRTNNEKYVEARYFCYVLLRESYMPYQQIAKAFFKNHSTIIKVMRTWDGYVQTDKVLAARVKLIKEAFSQLPSQQ